MLPVSSLAECIALAKSKPRQFNLAPAATPRAIVAKLNETFVTALKTPEMKERLFALCMDVTWSTPEQFGEQIREEIAQWSKAVKAAGAKAD